ncbi:MAG: DUF6252 family protein [Candidatus Eisenbacteria bacterium]
MAAAIFLVALSACGGGDDDPSPAGPSGPDPSDDGEMTATVDGAAWAAATSSLSATLIEDVPGGILIEGTADLGVAYRQITLSLYNIDGTGTYPLGVTASMFGGYATYAISGGQWHSPYTGASGSVTIQELSNDRIKGTFQFHATPILGSQSPTTHDVTGGQFDLPLESPLTAVPVDVGGSFHVKVGDVDYSASYFAVTPNGTGGYVLTTGNDDYQVGIFLDGIAGTGSYPLSFPTRSIVINPGNSPSEGISCCWGPSLEDTGTITLTTISADRLVGTFSATLAPRNGTDATESVTLVGGMFDLGLSVP